MEDFVERFAINDSFRKAIRKRERKLESGDFCFPVRFLPNFNGDKDLKDRLKLRASLFERDCTLSLRQGTVFLKLNRPHFIAEFLQRFIIEDLQFDGQRKQVRVVHLDAGRGNLMSQIRRHQACEVIRHLLRLQHEIVASDDHHSDSEWRIYCMASSDKIDQKLLRDPQMMKSIEIGAVGTNPGNLESLSRVYVDTFSRLKDVAMERENLTSSATLQHRIHVATCAHLQFQLFSTRLKSPITWRDSNEVTVKSDASFVLYNYARIVQLLSAFSSRCHNDYGGPLPEVKDIDFGLLVQEEEWEIVFVFLAEYKDFIRTLIEGILQDGKLDVHKLCSFLIRLSGVFSKYYKRVRVLREAQRPHLLPCMRARLYLYMALKRCFEHALKLLNIEPLHRM